MGNIGYESLLSLKRKSKMQLKVRRINFKQKKKPSFLVKKSIVRKIIQKFDFKYLYSNKPWLIIIINSRINTERPGLCLYESHRTAAKERKHCLYRLFRYLLFEN